MHLKFENTKKLELRLLCIPGLKSIANQADYTNIIEGAFDKPETDRPKGQTGAILLQDRIQRNRDTRTSDPRN